MDRMSLWRDSTGIRVEEPKKTDLEARVLRNKLINLTLDWELAALTLDAQRYKANETLERESLRDSAIAYRKCISELSEVLSGNPMLACKTY
jgi:hypothetical protein